MGAPSTFEDGYYDLPIHYYNHWSTVKYHTSWDWLMPVVDKIENYGAVTIIKNGCKIESIDQEVTEGGSSTLEATYTAVIKFIQYLNERKVC